MLCCFGGDGKATASANKPSPRAYGDIIEDDAARSETAPSLEFQASRISGEKYAAAEPAAQGTVPHEAHPSGRTPSREVRSQEGRVDAISGCVGETAPVETDCIGSGGDCGAFSGETWTLDKERLERIRRLCNKEAHLRAAAELDAYRKELRANGATGALDKLDKFCKDDEGFRRLEFKAVIFQEVISSFNGNEVQWSTHLTQGTGDEKVELWGRRDGPVLVYSISARFPVVLFRMLSLFRETDLYPKWLPFVWHVVEVHVVEGGGGDYAQFILLMKYVLPWPLKNREALVLGMGCDALEQDLVLLRGFSLPETQKEWWGYPLPEPGPGAVRVDLELNVIVKPADSKAEKTKFDFVMKMDPKANWVPATLLDWAGNQFVKMLFSNITSIMKNFSKSPYPERIQKNQRGFYTLLEDGLGAWTRGRLDPEL